MHAIIAVSEWTMFFNEIRPFQNTNEVESSHVELRLHHRNSANQSHFFGTHFLCSSVTPFMAESSPVKLQFSLCRVLMSRARFELIRFVSLKPQYTIVLIHVRKYITHLLSMCICEL